MFHKNISWFSNAALQIFEDLYTYMQSLNKILNLNPTKLYPGHGPVVNDPHSHVQYYIQHRIERENEILEAMKNSDNPMTVKEIVKSIYKV